MVLPSPTLRCCTPSVAQWRIIAHASTFNSNTVPRVTNLYSAVYITHKGPLWHSLKRCIHRDLTKCLCCVCVYVCCAWVTCTYSGVDMYSSIRTYIHSFKRWCRSRKSWYVTEIFQTQTNMSVHVCVVCAWHKHTAVQTCTRTYAHTYTHAKAHVCEGLEHYGIKPKWSRPKQT